MNILLLMMGGQGLRFRANIPKQYTKIHGRPMFSYIVKKYSTCGNIDGMILVSHKDWIPYVEEEMQRAAVCSPFQVIAGGKTRSQSVLNGLVCAATSYPQDSKLLIHDATHPYVDIEGTREILASVGKGKGATLGALQYDTVYQTDTQGWIERVLSRERVVSGASPEAFLLEDLYPIYRNASPKELEAMTSAGAIALAHKIPMKVIPSRVLNLKITHPEDMVLFEHLAEGYFFTE
ncbi:MAG: NTP transferase domain-containing protein [Lachnospiraceae bacterium]|nr:NTP transferase domain-containing protein [Lachnospiraceae bacterium]